MIFCSNAAAKIFKRMELTLFTPRANLLTFYEIKIKIKK